MLEYMRITYMPPAWRSASERVGDWVEIWQRYSQLEAAEQASRCITCNDRPCQTSCPLGQDPPEWLRAAAEGRLEDAHHLAFPLSPMYGYLGKLCPQDEGLCQTGCTVHRVTEAAGMEEYNTIGIGAGEADIWENAVKAGKIYWKSPPRKTGKFVGVIGAGIAATYAAISLMQEGHDVTMIDPHDGIGGLIRYGIPDFKAQKNDLDVVQNGMVGAGIHFKFGHIVIPHGHDTRSWRDAFNDKPESFRQAALTPIPFADLLNKYDAVLDASGAYKPNQITYTENQPIEGYGHVVQAMDFLTSYNKMVRFAGVNVSQEEGGRYVPPQHRVAGKRIVIIGAGGDTGQDCIRTALRAGASEVTCLHRSDVMRAAKKEVKAAHQESDALLAAGAGKGMEFSFSVHPIKIEKVGDEYIVYVQKNDGSVDRIHTDLVVSAVGFKNENKNPGDFARKWGVPDLQVFDGTSTSIANLFVGGDASLGASLLVRAGTHARQGADVIDAYLRMRVPSRKRMVQETLRSHNLLSAA